MAHNDLILLRKAWLDFAYQVCRSLGIIRLVRRLGMQPRSWVCIREPWVQLVGVITCVNCGANTWLRWYHKGDLADNPDRAARIYAGTVALPCLRCGVRLQGEPLDKVQIGRSAPEIFFVGYMDDTVQYGLHEEPE